MSGPKLMRVLTKPVLIEPEPLWLRSYDPDAYEGLGDVVLTADRAKAMIFPDAMAAFEFWKQVSRVRPRRADGKPNRPLSAYTVEILDA